MESKGRMNEEEKEERRYRNVEGQEKKIKL